MTIHIKSAPNGDVTAKEISEAIDELARRIEAQGFDDLANKDVGLLNLTWSNGDDDFTDEEFFAEMVDAKATAIVPSLKRLLRAYIDADVFLAELYADEDGIAAFGHAMRALLLLDPVGSRDLFLDYLESMHYHARQTVHLVYGDYVKAHKPRTSDDIHLAIAATVHSMAGLDTRGGGLWIEFGLLWAAPQIMNGTEFGEAVVAVSDAYDARVLRRVEYRLTHRPQPQPPEAIAKELAEIRNSRSHRTPGWLQALLIDVPVRGPGKGFDANFGADMRKALAKRWDIGALEAKSKHYNNRMNAGFQALEAGNVEDGLQTLVGLTDEDLKGKQFAEVFKDAIQNFKDETGLK